MKAKAMKPQFDILKYYESIKKTPQVFIDVTKTEGSSCDLSATSFAVLLIFERYNLRRWFDLNPVFVTEDEKGTCKNSSDVNVCFSDHRPTCFPTKLENDFNFKCEQTTNLRYSKRPSLLVQEKNLIISGLGSVLRFVLKFSSLKEENEWKDELKDLLGFRESCLQACAQTSVWTRFCEVDMTTTMIDSLLTSVTSTHVEIPSHLLRFEHHLKTPCRIHNFRKHIQQRNKINSPSSNSKENDLIGVDSLTKDINNLSVGNTESIQDLSHDFAEGPSLNLSDFILFPCVDLALSQLGTLVFLNYLPNVYSWYDRVNPWTQENCPFRVKLNSSSSTMSLPSHQDVKVIVPEVPQESLYKSDPARYKSSSRLYTKQGDIERVSQIVQASGIEIMDICMENSIDGIGLEPFLDWESAPPLSRPDSGTSFPESRAKRKWDQLTSIVQMVQFILKKFTMEDHSLLKESCPINAEIVDFCAGGGHVGILLATLFPFCHVTLVENKEESLRRAQERVFELCLSNVSFVQCNLNNFDFEAGTHGNLSIFVALHACGTATDLVLSKCLQSRASFVVSPCCYGSIETNHLVQYPRSLMFRNSGLSEKDYITLAHASDQTHEEKNVKTSQGKLCMKVIDTDRLRLMEENYYTTYLRRMSPETASLKNHILVGTPRSESERRFKCD